MKRLEPYTILMVGNNPIALSAVAQKTGNYNHNSLKTTFLFDLSKLSGYIKKLHPAAIFIEDSLNMKEVRRTIFRLHSHKNTAHIPVTLIKGSNFTNYPNLGADDYLLKGNLSASSIYQSVKNGRQFRTSRIYLKKMYRKHKGFVVNAKEWFVNYFLL